MKIREESFDEYRTRILKRNCKTRHIPINYSWGSKYIYRSVDKNHIIKSIDECTFLSIIRDINNLLADKLALGNAISIPHLGTFYITSPKVYSTITKDNKFRNYRKIDWYATNKLWYEDPEAEKEKILIKNKQDNSYYIVWNRGRFINCTFFKFRANRSLKAKLKNNINNNVNFCIYL